MSLIVWASSSTHLPLPIPYLTTHPPTHHLSFASFACFTFRPDGILSSRRKEKRATVLLVHRRTSLFVLHYGRCAPPITAVSYLSTLSLVSSSVCPSLVRPSIFSALGLLVLIPCLPSPLLRTVRAATFVFLQWNYFLSMPMTIRAILENIFITRIKYISVPLCLFFLFACQHVWLSVSPLSCLYGYLPSPFRGEIRICLMGLGPETARKKNRKKKK